MFTTKTGKTRRSAIDERTTRHDGYGMSLTRRKMIDTFLVGENSTARCAKQNTAASPASPETSSQTT